MSDLFSFLKNYEMQENHKTLMSTIEDLSERIKILEEKYEDALLNINILKEENIEATNLFYEIMNNIDAVDARIDILTFKNWKSDDVC